MIIDKFRFENKDYVIELQDSMFMVFYREEADSFSWFSEPVASSQITNDIKEPTKLLRRIANKVKQFLYEKKVKYFYLTVDDDKRKRLYLHFLKKLSGYDFQVTDNTINVFKSPNDL